ncbi:MAG TPA: hypothetical protein VFQ53_16945 [Kofleriaceae bacterium]|nr:hypothetical protein [Kofleriaceae bacterium]
MRTFVLSSLVIAATAVPAAAKPVERRLHSDTVDASSFLWNDWNKFVENYHPNYVADDDPATAWVEGAKTTGAGEWIRVQLTPLDQTTRIRLRVRNGYQKSKDLFAANARAKEVTLRLLPSKVEKKLTLADKDGWQDLVIDQPAGQVRAVELAVGSVYEGSKYPDLCISDVQVFATSETPDNPAFEKSKREALLAWRAARIAAAKQMQQKGKQVPLYPAYATTATDHPYDGNWELKDQIAEAQRDAAFQKEWKDTLAIAASTAASLDKLAPAQLSPASSAKLVAVDGMQIPTMGDLSFEPWFEENALRLPMLGTVAALFADQLRVLDLKAKDAQLAADYEGGEPKSCKGPDHAWVVRQTPKEANAPAKVQAVVIGRCGRVQGREGTYIARTLEMMVYDAQGRLALVVGTGHLDAYRWEVVDGQPKLAGGRSLLVQGKIVEAKRRDAVAKQ